MGPRIQENNKNSVRDRVRGCNFINPKLMKSLRSSCGVLPVSIFRDVHVNYVFRRLGEATDEFFDALLVKMRELMPGNSKEEHLEKMVGTLTKTVPSWSGPIIKQRVQRLLELARDFESAFNSTFAIYVKDSFANDLHTKKVRICLPRLTDFVHMYFVRICLAPEVKRGAYFDPHNTHARNFAVCNAMLDALAEASVDNVRVSKKGELREAEEEESDEELREEEEELREADEMREAEEEEPREAHERRFNTFVPPVTANAPRPREEAAPRSTHQQRSAPITHAPAPATAAFWPSPPTTYAGHTPAAANTHTTAAAANAHTTAAANAHTTAAANAHTTAAANAHTPAAAAVLPPPTAHHHLRPPTRPRSRASSRSSATVDKQSAMALISKLR